MRRDLAALDDAWSLRELKILRPSGEEVLTEGERDAMKEARGGQGGGRVVGGVAAGGVLPVTIAHYYVAVKREEDKYAMLQYLLTSVCPDRPALLFLGDNLRDSCCEGLEDCIPRLLKWVFGLVFLIGGILVELTMVIPCLCSPCCRKETEKEGTAAPAAGDVVQAQAVEVALAPSSNSTV